MVLSIGDMTLVLELLIFLRLACQYFQLIRYAFFDAIDETEGFLELTRGRLVEEQ